MEELLEMQKNLKQKISLTENKAVKLGIEVFRKIDEYDNYMVSNYGNVKNVKSGRIMKQNINSSGYYNVGLFKNGKGKTMKIHRLVAITFIANPENKNLVDHKDNNCLNNNISNLRWATSIENSQNSKKRSDNISGVKGVSYHKQHKKWRAQIMIDGKKKHIGYYNTLEDAKQARQTKAKAIFGFFLNACEK